MSVTIAVVIFHQGACRSGGAKAIARQDEENILCVTARIGAVGDKWRIKEGTYITGHAQYILDP